MADEIPTTGPAGTSNVGEGKPESPPQPAEEARFIEEVVIKPAPAKQVVTPPPPIQTPPPPPAPPEAPIQISAPAPPVERPPISPISESISVVSPPPPPHTHDELKKESEAITKILKEIKLPERHETPSEAQKPREAHVFDTMLGASTDNKINIPDTPLPGTAKAPETPPVIPHEGDIAPSKTTGTVPGGDLVSSIVSPFRTLKNDLQSIVRDKKISLVRAVALESEKQHAQGNIVEREQGKAVRSRKTFRILFAVFLLFALGAAVAFGVYVIIQERSGIPPQETGESLLFAEKNYAFPLEDRSPLEVKRLIAQARADSGAALGSITRFVPTKPETTPEGATAERPLTLEEFLRALGTRASPDLLRALSSEFFFGIHTVDENAPIFVIPVLSYERAFAGMLAWEQTMNADLAPAFTAVPDQVLGVSGLPEKRRFEDVVMRNYDVRALKNDAGTIELYYSFPTQHLLIIGESVYSFTEILSRLRAERKL
ncbi:hypothetical protein A3B35_00665 [Candidatus Kaiserbacteria bacterium RIFCSPLOWO2_01_FULL_54_24]|uniref:Uncharacterized protein n=2 Tax=Candidatus Kaiseribacteriota TaxID=1752734 RepID=A0A1F6ET25_9BACT|nr:MAG: hypothetical protein A3B35_00665 [Candidatus Kaiserbacteria bacterium RIFCSPLOWO2_01_FULL_54_24]